MAARLLNLLGVYLGPEEQLMGSHPDNPKGYWEYRPIVELTDEILARLGGTWHEPPPSPPGWEAAPGLADLRRRARDLIGDDFADRDWGWKDPRTCLTLPFWKALLPPIHYVICLRSPAEVAASVERRDGFSADKSARLWQTYTAAAIEQTAGFPRHILFYEDLIRSHGEEVARLADFLGRRDALEQPSIPSAISDFLEPDFRHHRTSLLNTLDDPRILFPAKALYFAIRALAAKGRPGPADLAGGDAVGEPAWPLFSRSSRRAQEEHDEQKRERDNFEARLGEVFAEAQGLRDRLAEREAQATASEAAHSALQGRSRGLEEQIGRLAEERDRAGDLAVGLRAELDRREAEAQEQARAIADRDAQLGDREARIAHLSERAALVEPLEEEASIESGRGRGRLHGHDRPS